MNAINAIGAPAMQPGRFDRLRDHPMPGEDHIPVTIDGVRLLVFHAAGTPTWCHIQLADGIVIPGVRASQAAPGSLHGKAVEVAGALLAGLHQGGEYPEPEPMRDWSFGLVCLGFSIGAFIILWLLVASAMAPGWAW